MGAPNGDPIGVGVELEALPQEVSAADLRVKAKGQYLSTPISRTGAHGREGTRGRSFRGSRKPTTRALL
eukprot:972648-Pyramimonas_sp.AAC.1